MTDSQDKKEEIIQPQGESLSPEQKIEFSQEGVEPIEKKDFTQEEIITKEALRREIDKMEFSDDLKEEANKKAQKIQVLGEEEKIGHLLEIVKERGVVFAIKTAERMNDPYILDTFHDILIKEWVFYKQFLR